MPRSWSEPIPTRRGDHRSPAVTVLPEVTGRDTAITVSVQPKCATEKTTPQSTASTAPLTQGRFFRCALRIFKYANYRCPVRNKGINHSISHPLIQRKICIVLAGSGSFPVLPAASIPGKRNKCIRSCVKAQLKKEHFYFCGV